MQIMDTVKGSNTFIKVDEVNESSGQVESLDPPQQQLTGDESWLDHEDAQELDPEEQKQNVSHIQIRPPMRKDQWAPAPQQPPPPASPTNAEETEGPTDSLSLMQLKRIVKDMPTKEPTPYDFKYSDSSSFENEVEELFSYSIEERRFLVHLPNAFQHVWQDFEDNDLEDTDDNDGEHQEHTVWWECDGQDRRAFLKELKSGISLHNQVDRLANIQALVYIALGCWLDLGINRLEPSVENHTGSYDADVGSEPGQHSGRPKKSLQSIEMQKNILLVEEEVGATVVFEALRAACSRAK